MTAFSMAAGLLIAAPPTLLRHGLLLTLREACPEHPASLTTAAQVLQLLHRQAFALLIIDCAAFAAGQLPSLLQQVQQVRPTLPWLLLTGRRPPHLPPATGTTVRLLPSRATPAEVASAAANLLHRPAARPLPRRAAQPASTGFSPRELEVLALVLDDLCNEQIANRLCLSVRTVETHRRNLLQKADVRTPVGLAVRALREGWLG